MVLLGRRLSALFFTAFVSLCAQGADVTVSAASSLTDAMKGIAPLFEAENPGTKLQFNFGASGALLAQIAKGAPADVFASADPQRMNQAQARNLIVPDARRDFASNALVVIVPAGARRRPASIEDLARPAFARIAIGLPASVPVGNYTKATLEQARLWHAVEPKMVGASNVRQALDYVARGEVDAGFVYATDAALMPDKVQVALSVPTPTRILYPVAPVAASTQPALARRFVEFLTTPPAQAVLARYGFGKP